MIPFLVVYLAVQSTPVSCRRCSRYIVYLTPNFGCHNENNSTTIIGQSHPGFDSEFVDVSSIPGSSLFLFTYFVFCFVCFIVWVRLVLYLAFVRKAFAWRRANYSSVADDRPPQNMGRIFVCGGIVYPLKNHAANVRRMDECPLKTMRWMLVPSTNTLPKTWGEYSSVERIPSQKRSASIRPRIPSQKHGASIRP